MKKTYSFAAMLLCAVLALAGCGNDSSSTTAAAGTADGGGSDLSQYQQTVDDGTAPVAWDGPTDAAKAPSGTSLAIVTCLLPSGVR